MAKYKIQGILGLSVGGHYYKPNEHGIFDLSPAEAEHLALTYYVVPIEGRDKDQPLGPGRTNAPDELKPKKVEITKESLLKMEPAELKEKAKALGIAIKDEMSRGDIAEAVMDFMERLSKLTVKK